MSNDINLDLTNNSNYFLMNMIMHDNPNIVKFDKLDIITHVNDDGISFNKNIGINNYKKMSLFILVYTQF